MRDGAIGTWLFSAVLTWSLIACVDTSRVPIKASSVASTAKLTACWELLAWPEYIDVPIRVTTMVSLDSVPLKRGRGPVTRKGTIVEPVQNFPIHTPIVWTLEPTTDTLVIDLGEPPDYVYRLGRADSVWAGAAYSVDSMARRHRFGPSRGRQVPCSKASDAA